MVKKGAAMPRRGENIRKRNDGRWEGRYRHKDLDGTYKYKSIYGKTYREVKERMSEMYSYANVNTGELFGDNMRQAQTIECGKTNMLFIEVSEKWLAYMAETKKYSTYIKYFKLYERHIKEALQKSYILDISNELISQRIFEANEHQKFSTNMKHSILAIVNQILKYANEYCQCPSIKLSNKYPRDRKNHIEIINHSDQALLLKYLYQDTDLSKVGIIICISTGLRLGEICSLKWEDIDLEQMIIHVKSTVQRVALLNQEKKTALMTTSPKSIFSVREIPISKELKELLDRFKNDQEYVLGGDKPMEPRTYQNRFRKYLCDINVKRYNFHILRHTFATNCIDSGMDVKSLSEILGHSDVQITLNRYVHPTMDTKRKYIVALSAIYSQYCGQIVI